MTRRRNHVVRESGSVLARLEKAVAEEEMTPRVRDTLVEFYATHHEVALDCGNTLEDEEALWLEFVGHVIDNIAAPYPFPSLL